MKKRRSQDTRHTILKVAIKIFAEKGYSATPTIRIAEEAGISEATIFKYFKTKKDLLYAIFEEYMGMIEEEFFIKPMSHILHENKGKSDEQILKELLSERISIWEKYEPIGKIVISELLHQEDFKENYFERFSHVTLKAISDYIQEGIKLSKFRDVNSIIAAKCFCGLLISYMVFRNVTPDTSDKYDSEGEFNSMVDVFLNGLNVS